MAADSARKAARYDRKQGTMITYIADAIQRGVRLLHHCDVDKITFHCRDREVIAAGAEATVRETEPGSQPNLLAAGPVTIDARLVIVASGAVESPCLLQRSGHPDPYDLIGRGLILHPSLAVIGVFDRELTNYQGISGSVYSDHFLASQGFYLECMFGHPVYGASIVPGFGAEHFETMRQYRKMAGFGVMLVDSVSRNNRVRHDPLHRRSSISYRLSDADKSRFRYAASRAIEVMLAAGAKLAFLPSEEQLGPLGAARFRNAQDAVHCRHLEFRGQQTALVSAHPQATVKMGEDTRQSLVNSRCESHHVRNLLVCDSSAFPTSCGANPMISIMTLARYQARRIGAEQNRY